MPRVSSHFGLRDPRLQSVTMPMIVPITISTAGNVTYTPAQLMSGFIMRDGNGGARTDNLPSAAAMAEAVQGARMVGTSFECSELRDASGTADCHYTHCPATEAPSIRRARQSLN